MNSRESFGINLRKSRELKKLSISEVATKSGLEPNTIVRIEDGKFNPGLDILQRIADALEMELKFAD